MIKENDPFIRQIIDQQMALVAGNPIDTRSLRENLFELAMANFPRIQRYWKSSSQGFGIPDSAYKDEPLHWFPPVLSFETSGTTGKKKGRSFYSEQGKRILDASIIASAQGYLFKDMENPVVIRLVPSRQQAPKMVMAYGMELIATHFGNPDLSDTVIEENGLNYKKLKDILSKALSRQQPVLMIGGTMSFYDLCSRMQSEKESWNLPKGSKILDAGGSKSKLRTISINDMKDKFNACFNIPSSHCINLFGMTELASQLYDVEDIPLGPTGERPKNHNPSHWIYAEAIDPVTQQPKTNGLGLLQVTDLCLLDKPCTLITGDYALANEKHGVAITGRINTSDVRGCSISLEAMTQNK